MKPMNKHINKRPRPVSFGMKKFLTLTLLAFLLIPSFSFAQTGGSNCSNSNIQGLLVCFRDLLNKKMIPIAASLALLYFFWGVMKIIRAQDDTKLLEEGKKIAFWGIIALFIIASIGAIILFLQNDLLGGVSNTL